MEWSSPLKALTTSCCYGKEVESIASADAKVKMVDRLINVRL